MASFYSLDKVNDIADNDSDFIKVLVQTFLEEIPEDLEQLSSAVENNNKEVNWDTVYFVWKRYLTENDYPNLLFIEPLKNRIILKFKYNENGGTMS